MLVFLSCHLGMVRGKFAIFGNSCFFKSSFDVFFDSPIKFISLDNTSKLLLKKQEFPKMANLPLTIPRWQLRKTSILPSQLANSRFSMVLYLFKNRK
jgi:hypothetical protein